MPPRSVKMKRRIFGFQRRVWWPKCTPASKSSRIETTDIGMKSPFWLVDSNCRWAWLEPASVRSRHRHPGGSTGLGLRSGSHSSGHLQVFRQWRLEVDSLAGERMREREPRRVQELALESQLVRPPVHRVAGHRQVHGGEVDADLVRASRLE